LGDDRSEEQRKRFLERIDDPEKNWKFSLADVEERNFWTQYMKGYMRNALVQQAQARPPGMSCPPTTRTTLG
jgi:polyphosphate kinase 2 (PPK2 family)